MGIRGMETYLEQHSNACSKVNVVDLIHLYRDENKCTPVIVIDGMSILRYVYKFRNLSWVLGGQMKEYEQNMRDFILAFQNEGAELVFFYDGPFISSKTETWIKRRLQSLDKVYKLFDDLEAGGSILKTDAADPVCLPANLRLLTIYVAEKCNCKVFSSIRECDMEISEYAAKNKCMAILAQDSDFVIFEGAIYYWSMKNFNFDKMTTLNYNRKKLASSLGITTEQLPILATLLGNDVISFESLREFHHRILKKCGVQIKKNWIDYPKLIKGISQIVHNLPGGFVLDKPTLQRLAQKAFSDPSEYILIEESIQSYDFNADKNKDHGCPRSANENWSNILKKVHESFKLSMMSPTVYGIIVLQRYNCSTCLEDYRMDDLPASQTIMKPLRQRFYGVLLFEKPGDCEVEDGVLVQNIDENSFVTEMVMCGPDSLDEPVHLRTIKPTVHHPGLLALWSGQDMDQNWNLMGDIFGFNPGEIKALPQRLIVPALTLRYLCKRVAIEQWELQALVSSAVLVQLYNATFLSRIPVSKTITNTRPIRLYTLVSRSYSTTVLVFSGLGNILPTDMLVSSNYQDGKLFHHKYQLASNKTASFDLCDKKDVAFEQFNTLMHFIDLQ